MAGGLPIENAADQYDMVDFGQLFGLIKKRAVVIAIFMAVVAIAALAHALLATPQFTAQGVLYLGETQRNGDSGDAGPVDLSAFSATSDVETQIGLLTTGTLIQRAVLETGLNTTLRPVGMPKRTYWRWKIFSHGSTAVFVPGAGTLQVVDTTLAGRFRIITGRNNTYRLYDRTKTLGGTPLLTGVIGLPEAVGAYSITVQAGTLAPGSEASFSPPGGKTIPGVAYDLDVVPPDVLAADLSGVLSVTAGGDLEQPTQLATLQLRWNDPYKAKQFINQLMNDYIATQLQWKTQAASVTESFVTAQLVEVAKRLAQANKNLARFESQTGILDPRQSAQQTSDQMAQFQTQRATILLQQREFRHLYNSIKSKNAGRDPYLISSGTDPVLSGLSSSLANALVQLRQLGAEYTSASQDIGVQESQVDELRNSIATLIKNDLDQTTANLAAIDQVIGSYRHKLQAQPAEALRVAALTRTSDQLGQFYGLLTEKAEEARLSKAATIIATRVVAPAEMPRGATSPKATIAVVGGAIAGLFLGIIYVFLKQTLSSRYESEEQVRRLVKLPVYGKIPTQKLVGTGSNFFGPNMPNAFSEAFQMIKRNINRLTRRQKGTVLLVISANERDGKTMVATNLAKTFADDGKRAVMLDCDFYLSRLPTLGAFYGAPGLTDWLTTGERPPLQQWPGESFFVLPAGVRPKRNMRLDESALAEIVNQLRAEFDYVILDSPPLPVVSDGLVLADLADVILSVISIRKTERRAFDYHHELLAEFDRLHGIIINGAEGSTYAESETYFTGPKKRRHRIAGWLNAFVE